jgi:hypothetical protein
MSASNAPRRRRERISAIRLHPFEIVSFGAAAVAIAFLRSYELDYGWNTIAFTIGELAHRIPLMLVVGVALRAIATWIVGEPVGAYLRSVARPRWLVEWLRLVAAFVAYIYAYLWLKVSIPLLRLDLFDAEIWRIDRWLHVGVSPTVFAIELVANTPLAWAIDRYYAYWIIVIPVWTAYVYAATGDSERRHFALGVAMLWVAGSWIYFLVPAVGPCFWSEDFLAPVREQMPLVANTQAALWVQYRNLAASEGRTMLLLSPALGVAAMPSLHVGAYVFFALWAKRHARRWYRVWILAAVLVFFGSLATAWHYAVDGYVGALLAWAAVRVADRLEPAAGENPPASSTEAPESGAEAATGGAP